MNFRRLLLLLVYPRLPFKGGQVLWAIETSTGKLCAVLLREKLKSKPCGKIYAYSVQEKTGLQAISIQMIYSLPYFQEFIGI